MLAGSCCRVSFGYWRESVRGFCQSRAAIEAFAGKDIDTAVFYPDDNQFLIERDLTVNHYEVVGRSVKFIRRAPRGR